MRSLTIAVLVAALVAFWSVGFAQAALVGYWAFDNSANLGFDSSAQANHLVGSGTPTYDPAGRFGGALSLDGPAQSDMLVPSSGFPTGIPTGGSSYTISAWIKPDVGGNLGIVGWGNYGSGSQVNAFRMDGTNALHNYWWSNDLNSGAALQSGDLLTGWHHVAVTYDAGTGRQQMFVDGIQRSSRIAAAPNVGQANFAIGRTVSPEFFDGLLDDVAIFNNALSTDQVKALAAGTARPYAFPYISALAGLWRFDSADLGQDSSVNKNHLTAYGNQVTLDAGGKYHGALRLGGSDDYLAMAGDTGGDFAGLPAQVPYGRDSYTIAAWIKPDSDVVFNGGIVGWGNYGTGNQVNAFRLQTNDGLWNYWWGNDYGQDPLSNGTNLLDGQWHHVAVSYDSVTGVHSLYVDGQFLGSRTAFGIDVRPENFRIGTTNGLAEDFKGLMDDLAIFNRALTPAEILAVRAGDFSAFGVPEPTTFALLGLGLFALMACRRPRRK